MSGPTWLVTPWKRACRVRPLAQGLVLLALLGLPGVPSAAHSAPRLESFDAANALAHATHLAGTIGERAAGTPGEAAAGEWIAGQFAALGLTVERQSFPLLRFAVPFTGTNVIAEKAGLPGYGTLYVGAHYDTVYPQPGSERHGPGANDNASGTSVLLEAARVVAAESFSPTVKFIAFSGEEDGLVGSYYFVARLPLADRLAADGMLNLDCVGIGDTLQLLVTRSEHLPFAASLGVTADEVTISPGASSDHAPFAAAGIPAAFFYMEPDGTTPCGPDYHKVTDTPDKLEQHALARTGDGLVVALRNLAASAAPRTVHFAFLPALAR